MVRLREEKCCDACWHRVERECPKFIECLSEGPLCHEDTKCRDRRKENLAVLRRDVVSRPVIFVGAGTCGLGAGARRTLDAVKEYLAQRSVAAELVEVGCIGLCASEPILDVQMPGRTRVSFGDVNGERVPLLLDAVLGGQIPAQSLLGQHRNGQFEPWPGVPFLDEHPFFARQTRWVLENCGMIDPRSIDEYVARDGYRTFAKALRTMTPAEVCAEVTKSGLRGRGGAGFPTGAKWTSALRAPADQKYLVCNAEEGDPGAFMDRAVIEGDPHRVIEGMALAAYTIGATKAYLYLRAEYPRAVANVKEALAQAQAFGLLGRNILDSGLNLDIIVKIGAGAFVCGEETALIHSIEGKRGMPRPRPPFPVVKGLFDKPTVINNVETLANIPRIVSLGGDKYASLGTETSKGTKVFALCGKVVRAGLVEVAMGTTIRQIVMDIGGGIPNGKAYKAVQIGGPCGGCIPPQHLDVKIDYETLKSVGAILGSGGLVVMDEDTCMVDVAKYFMDFIQRESCGKCIPCREGTRRMLEVLRRITRSRRNEARVDALERFKSVMYLNRLAEVIKDTSLCGLGQAAPNPVLSTLRWFRDEYEAHIYERRCPAGVCQELVSYRIDQELCKGCTLCAKKCPVGAIMGAKQSPHYIVPEKCVGCGTCLEVCDFHAIIRENSEVQS